MNTIAQILYTIVILMVLIYGIAARYDFTDQLKKIYFDFGLNLTKTTFETLDRFHIVSPISTALMMTILLLQASNKTEEQLRLLLHVEKSTNDNLKNGSLSIINDLMQFQGYLKFSLVYGVQGEFNPSSYLLNYDKSNPFNFNIVSCDDDKQINFCHGLLFNDFKVNVITKFRARPSKPFIRYNNNLQTRKGISTSLTGHLLYQSDKFRYGENACLNAKWIEIPLESTSTSNLISMFIVVPNEQQNLMKIVRQINDLRSFFPNDTVKRTAQLLIPEFRVRQEYPGYRVWQQMGIDDIFESNRTADFNKLFKESKILEQTYHMMDLIFEASEIKNDINRSDNDHEFNLDFDEDIFIVNAPFIGFIVSENIIHYCFKVMPVNNRRPLILN